MRAMSVRAAENAAGQGHSDFAPDSVSFDAALPVLAIRKKDQGCENESDEY